MLLIRKCFERIIINPSVVKRSITRSVIPDFVVPKETIGDYLIRFCSKYSDRIAFIDDARKIHYKYSDVSSIIHSISSSLTKRGMNPGTMVAMIAPNSPEYFMLIAAISSMGCSVTLCNQNYTDKEMVYQLSDSQPVAVFTDKDNLDKVSKAVSQTPSVKNVYVIGEKVDGYGSVDELLTDPGNCSLIGQINIDLDEHVALLPYSSGTTGLPKGVMLTHKNIVSSFEQFRKGLIIPSHQTLLGVLPFYHIYGAIVPTSMSFNTGSTLVTLPKFDPLKFLSAIEKHKISVIHVVPPQVLFLLNHPSVAKYDISSIKVCLSGAAPLDGHVELRLIEKLRAKQPDFILCQGYGLTEVSAATMILPTDNRKGQKQGSVGLLAANMTCKVVDVSTREEVGVNEIGEILLKGPNISKGYYRNSTATEQAFEDGWLRTGDIGHYDNDMYFYVSDRIKELIKVQGKQVAPAELEAVLLNHPSVQDCAVVGVPDSKYGEVPCAFVVKSGEIDEKSIHDHMAAHLSPYKQLKGGIKFVTEIPKSPSGKILRRLLKDKQ